jgi:hypothetical protein
MQKRIIAQSCNLAEKLSYLKESRSIFASISGWFSSKGTFGQKPRKFPRSKNFPKALLKTTQNFKIFDNKRFVLREPVPFDGPKISLTAEISLYSSIFQ